jgi:NAD+ synthase (glutamine-hydrolysing)
MKDGFIKCAVASAHVKVADSLFNTQTILLLMRQAEQEQVRLLVLPELVTSAYTCADLFLQQTLQTGCSRQ